jgi:endonuclease/exonuclease/phosphatase (EEP) superfamily protein YafD
MLSVLFWNLNRRYREDRCASLVRTLAPTLLVLAECPDPLAVERAITALDPANPWSLLPTACGCRVRVLSKLPMTHWPVVEERRRYAIHRLELPSAEELLVVSLHLRSKLTSPEPEQDAELRKLAARIVATEQTRGHARTLLIGDLNAHPFQPGVGCGPIAGMRCNGG